MALSQKRAASDMDGFAGEAGCQKRVKSENGEGERVYTAAELDAAVMKAKAEIVQKNDRLESKIGELKDEIGHLKRHSDRQRLFIRRVQRMNSNLVMACKRSDAAWNGKAGLLLIKGYASSHSMDLAARVTPQSLKKYGVAKMLRIQMAKQLSTVCEQWESNATQRGSLHGDATFTTSLANDLQAFWKIIDLLASLPNGNYEAAKLAIRIGTEHMKYDKPLLIGANCDPGTDHYLEALDLWQALDEDVKSLLETDPDLFGGDLTNIQEMINHIRNTRHLEEELRFEERQFELAKSFGYDIGYPRHSTDDETFHEQGIEDMTDEEKDEFDRQFDVMQEAMHEGRLSRHFFPWTCGCLRQLRDTIQAYKAEEQERERIAAEKEARLAEEDARQVEEEGGSAGDDGEELEDGGEDTDYEHEAVEDEEAGNPSNFS